VNQAFMVRSHQCQRLAIQGNLRNVSWEFILEVRAVCQTYVVEAPSTCNNTLSDAMVNHYVIATTCAVDFSNYEISWFHRY